MALGTTQTLWGGQVQNQQSTSTPVNVNPFTAALAPTIQGMAGAGLPQYTGPTFAPLGANAENVLGQLMATTGTNSPNQGYLASVLGGNYLPGQPGANPFLESAIQAAQRPTMEGLEQVLSKTLPGRFTAAGQFVQPQGSSAFDNAAALATRGAAQASADIATNMSYQAYGQERGMQQAAVQLNQQEVQNTVANLQAQALPQMIQQQGIQNALSLFQTNLSGILQLLSTIGQIAQPQVGQVASSTGEGESTGGIVPAAISAFAPKGPGGGSK